MPYHGTEVLDPAIDKWLRSIPAMHTALDVGVGSGSRGLQIKIAHPSAKLIGYETEVDYNAQFNLSIIYTDLRLRNVMELVESDGCEHYDLVFLGDVIEHLKRSEGLDLIHYLVYRTRHLIVSYPERYRQDSWEGHKSEAHRSVWTVEDFNMYAPLMVRRAESEALPGVAISVLIHGMGYGATDEDRRIFKGEH